LQGAVGGFTALQGAMGLFGSESKQVEQLLLKVQSAMALQQGISAITSSKDSFKLLGAEIKLATIKQKALTAATAAAAAVQKLFTGAVTTTSTAFKVLKTAIISTGIGALIVLAGTLIGKIMDWNDSTDDAKKKQDELAEATKRADAALSQQVDTLSELTDIQVKRARIAGASEAQINKIQADGIQQRINLINDEISTRIKAGQSFTDLSKQLGELQNQQLNQQLDFELKTAEKSRENAKNAQKKKSDDAKAAADKARQEQKADNDAAEKQLRELQQENFLNSIEDQNKRAQEKARLDFENAKKEIEATKATEENKNAVKKQLRLRYEEQLRDLELELLIQQNERDAQASEEEKKKAEERDKAELERIKNFNQLKKQQDEEFKKAQLEAEKNLQSARFQAIDAGFDLINALAGKNEKVANILFGVQKALEIGKIIVGAASAIAQIKQNIASVPPFLGPAPNPAYFVNLALGLKNIAAVKLGAAAGIATIVGSTIAKFKGGGSSVQSGGGTPAQPGGGAAQGAPIQPQAQTTRIDQGQINQIGNAAVRSYVLETDVANNQERRIRIERAARIG
jgi:chemotaxis protein histidine kinase CheA